MKDNSPIALAILVALITIGSCMDSCNLPAHAQVRADCVTARAALMARVRSELAEVSISRFLCGESDCSKRAAAALLWTMKRRAEKYAVRFLPMLYSYSAPLRGHGGARGAWVRALPELPSAGYRGSWLTGIDAARAFIARKLPDPCAGPTNHFGSRADVARRFPNAVPIDCGDTDDGNIYFDEDQAR